MIAPTALGWPIVLFIAEWLIPVGASDLRFAPCDEVTRLALMSAIYPDQPFYPHNFKKPLANRVKDHTVLWQGIVFFGLPTSVSWF